MFGVKTSQIATDLCTHRPIPAQIWNIISVSYSDPSVIVQEKTSRHCAHSATTATTNCNNCEDCRTFNVFKKMSVLVYAPTHLSPHTHTESTWTLLPGNPSHPKAPSTDSALTWHQAQAGSGLQHSQPSDQMTGKSKGLINMEL